MFGVELDDHRGHDLGGIISSTRGGWEYAEEMQLLKKSNTTKEAETLTTKFLLKYDLDEDPIEEFTTLVEVKKRIKEIAKKDDLKRESIVVYEIKRKMKVTLQTKTVVVGL